MVGVCQEGGKRFELDGAAEMELIGYDVKRLDPRALVDYRRDLHDDGTDC